MPGILIMLLFTAMQGLSQKPTIFKGPNNLYGLKDSKGTVILAPKYDDISKFENGLARVRLGKIEDIDSWKRCKWKRSNFCKIQPVRWF